MSIRCSTSQNEENGRLYHSMGAVSVTELWRHQIERVRSQRHGLGEILEQPSKLWGGGEDGRGRVRGTGRVSMALTGMGAEDWSWRIYQSSLNGKLMNRALECVSLCPNF